MAETGGALLTGAFGTVGSETLRALVKAGRRVTALDVRSPATAAQQERLAADLTFDTAWVDLTDRDAVDAALAAAAPEAILHVAAVIPPLAYTRPDLARRVNIEGTRNLLESAATLPIRPRVVYTSSYSVHGPNNPHRRLPPWTGETPLAAADNYACHKVTCEGLLRASELPWVILRLPAVAVRSRPAMSDDALRFSFLVPPDQPSSGIDVLDAAAALVSAVDADCVGRIFDIAGDESWRMTMGELVAMMFEAFGLPPLPADAYRRADPDVDDSWYFGADVVTTEAQRVLHFQHHTREQYQADIGVSGPMRWLTGLSAPLVRRRLLALSPYHGRPARPDPTPMRQVILEAFDIDPTEAEC